MAWSCVCCSVLQWVTGCWSPKDFGTTVLWPGISVIVGKEERLGREDILLSYQSNTKALAKKYFHQFLFLEASMQSRATSMTQAKTSTTIGKVLTHINNPNCAVSIGFTHLKRHCIIKYCLSPTKWKRQHRLRSGEEVSRGQGPAGAAVRIRAQDYRITRGATWTRRCWESWGAGGRGLPRVLRNKKDKHCHKKKHLRTNSGQSLITLGFMSHKVLQKL